MAVVKKTRIASQDGFVLVAAIMALMIFIAVGFYALTVSTQDLRVSSRLVGERKAFSAAQAGVNEMSRMLDPHIASVPIFGQKVDPVNDPYAEFDAAAIMRDTGAVSILLPGFSVEFESPIYSTIVTGRDTSYGARVRISVGLGHFPVPTTPVQGGG